MAERRRTGSTCRRAEIQGSGVTTALAINDPIALRQQLAELAERCVDKARTMGASSAEAGASSSAGLSVTARMGEVETVEHIRDKGIGITVYFGQRKGTASTSDFSDEALSATVASACAIARHTGADEFAGLADPDLMATEFPDLDLYHPWDVEAAQAIELAVETEAHALQHDPRVTNSDGATVGSHETAHAYVNSHGFVGLRGSTRHSISCSVIAEDASGMQTDYWYDTARRHGDMASGASIGQRAAERTVARLNPRQLATGQHAVLYPPELASSLFAHFAGAIRGGSLYRKASFLLDQLGEPVFANHVRVHEQPHLQKGAGSAAFDSEGVATRPRDIVTDGVLQGYVLDSYSGRRLGMPTTGNAGGMHNLTVDGGELDFDGLLAELGTGVLLGDMMGMSVNLVNGDYSRGAGGFWVEDGEICYPIQEFTVAGNLAEMFRHIIAIGNDTDTRGNLRCGSVLVAGMTVAGA